MTDKPKERSFRKEYTECLKDRDAQYLKHDKLERAWSQEREALQDKIRSLEAKVLFRGDIKEYVFHGLYRTPTMSKPLEVVAPVAPNKLNEFLHPSDGLTTLVNKEEGGAFVGHSTNVTWTSIELRRET
jgi:hypothetical protein